MKRRRLRRLVPDDALLRRRAAGETVRALAPDYSVSHTTLSRYFARPEVRKQLRESGALLAREALAAQTELERQVRRAAKRDKALEARLSAERARRQAARAGARSQTPYEAWLDHHDAREPLTRADLRTQNDRDAARVVAAGGGIDAIFEATGLRTRNDVLKRIEPAILVQAMRNDAGAAGRKRKRKAWPGRTTDRKLIQRRAAGETVRALAADYEVAPSTVSRYFTRPKIQKRLQTELERRV